jgi:glycosyltransferase involved in cell wall biosynthesis
MDDKQGHHCPALSVVIPCYNAEAVVGQQLEALALQEWDKSWEVIVSNNGSTDRSLDVVSSFSSRLKNLRLVDASSRRGQPYALNVGIAAARSHQIAICDADDVVGTGWVAAMGEALNKHELVAGRMDTKRLNPAWIHASIGQHQQEVGLQTSSFPPYLPHAGSGNLGVRRSVHESIGGFNEAFPYLLDTDYCFRAQLGGAKLQYVPEALVHIRMRQSLKGIYLQTRNWSQYESLLYKQYRQVDSAELWRWRAYFEVWLALLKRTPSLLRTPEGRGLLVWRLGRQIGGLRGAVLHGVPPVTSW